MKYTLKFCKRLGKNLHFLMFLNGFLLASIGYFFIQSKYETGLFSVIKSGVESHIDPDDTNDSVVVKAMNTCYGLMSNRASTFGGASNLGPEAGIFHSAAVDLMTTRGACGSYSEVLARIIGTLHYPVRIAQMKAGGIFAAHNVVEAYTGSHWVLLDPTYNLYFTKPNGQLACFNDIRQDWAYYSKQVPTGYNPKYQYEDVRYTNWSKIPFLSPVLKSALVMAYGREYVDGISLRVLFIDTWRIYYNLTMLVEVFLLLATIRIYIRRRAMANPNTRLKVKNLSKYLKQPAGTT
ncbi:MAG TPA: hypothetical protein VG605_02840 [Puia sp.]|nr:hypothetical protein [Puia sp.]